MKMVIGQISDDAVDERSRSSKYFGKQHQMSCLK